MRTTIATTSDVDAYTSIMPLPVRHAAEALFAELERYRIDAAALQARQDAQAAAMRHARIDPKRELVKRFISQHHAALLAREPRFRCGFLRQRMVAAQLRGECFDIPSDKFLRKCLNESVVLINNDHTPKG